MSFGKSRARLIDDKGEKVTFANVEGIDEAKEELEEVVEFLKTPDKFTRLGGRIPKGVLLVGNPGTGKTLLSRAVAGEGQMNKAAMYITPPMMNGTGKNTSIARRTSRFSRIIAITMNDSELTTGSTASDSRAKRE